MHIYTLATTAIPSFIQAQLPVEVKAVLFTGLIGAAIVLTAYLFLLRFPALKRKLMQNISNFLTLVSGQKREARLNKIVCYHCNKGMGLYNPTYLNIQGNAHIEGTCSLCGGFVRVRLN